MSRFYNYPEAEELQNDDVFLIDGETDGTRKIPANKMADFFGEQVPTDKTLSIENKAADAKKTGDEISDLKSAFNAGYFNLTNIEQGSLTSAGEKTSSTTRIRIAPQKVNAGDVLKVDSNLYYGILVWDGSLSTSNIIRNDYTGCPNGTDEVLFLSDGFFALTFRNSAETTISPSDFTGFVHLYKSVSVDTDTDTLIRISPSLYKYGYYYNANVGQTIESYESANFNSAVFDVKPNTTYKLQAQGRTTTSVYFHVIDSNNISLDKFGYAPSEMGGLVESIYTTPNTASKIIINCVAGTSSVAGKSMQYAKVWEFKTSGLQANYELNYTAEQKAHMLSNLGINKESEFISEQLIRALSAAKLFVVNDPAQNIAQNRLPIFIHVSDIHGDAECFDYAVDVADTIHADAIIGTGDAVYYYATDDATYIENKMSTAESIYLPCIGNHDSYVNTSAVMYSKFIEPFKDGLVFPQGVSNPTYYYRDFASKKIRIICVNQFEYRGVSNYATERNYSQEQITFLCNSLLSTPEGYGIIISMHTPEKTGALSPGYTKFYQTEIYYDNTGADISPVYEIVDAFISGTSINKTWNNISGNTPVSFTANIDFSVKNTGVEFIAYMTGHMHRDCVYYVPGVINKQLMLNITCTCHWSYKTVSGGTGGSYPYFTETGDLPRVEGTPTQNAINVYGIDRMKKYVKVARIGSEMPYDMDIRDYMVIPYAD